MNKKTVLITGVVRFIKSHCGDAFLAKKYKGIGIDNLSGSFKKNVSKDVTLLYLL